jgi:uncharacterized protein
VTLLKYATDLTDDPGEPSRPDAALVLGGAPRFTTWPGIEGRVSSGIWAATPGLHCVMRDDSTLEHFYILEGEIELAEEGDRPPLRFGPGDLVEIGPGFRGTWRTITPVRKIYFTTRL